MLHYVQINGSLSLVLIILLHIHPLCLLRERNRNNPLTLVAAACVHARECYCVRFRVKRWRINGNTLLATQAATIVDGNTTSGSSRLHHYMCCQTPPHRNVSLVVLCCFFREPLVPLYPEMMDAARVAVQAPVCTKEWRDPI